LLLADRWGIDERALHALAIDRTRGESLLAAARRLTDWPEDDAFLSLQDCLREVDRLVTRSYRVSLPRLVDELIAVVGGSYDVVQEANVRRFREVVRAFAESHVGDKPNLSELIGYLDLLLTAGPDEEAASEIDLDEADTVKIMTAHAAKGLEWPVVFVAGVNANDFAVQRKTGRKRDALPPELARPTDGRPLRSDFPDDAAGRQAFMTATDAWRKTEDDLEERRVFYVAVTRARSHLYLTWSETHPDRKKPTGIYKSLAPITDLCDHVLAPPAPPTPDTLTVETFARRTIPQLSNLLGAAGADPAAIGFLIDSLGLGWQSVGGDPATPEQAVAEFVAAKAVIEEQVAALRAVEARAAESEGIAAAAKGPISYSQLDVFRTCPHRYYLRHIIGLPGRPQTWAASYGTAFHDAVALEAKLRLDGKSVSIEDLRSWIHADLARNGNQTQANGDAMNGIDPVAAYIASVDHQATPLLIEEQFTLRLDHVVIKGVIDRLHRLPGGEPEIVDYKTDRQLRSAEHVKAGLQLPIYLLACREVFGDVCEPPMRAAMFFVRHGVRVEVEYSEAELAAARAAIIEEASRLSAVDPKEHHASPETCGHCEFRLTCRHAHRDVTLEAIGAD
jgi:DNA helicase-2/ATP-dependent DNA helicase PcrA